MSISNISTYARELIQRVSITPNDAGCQDWLENILAPVGFIRTRIDAGGVINSIFSRQGEQSATLAFAGHTDVVPAGLESKWLYPPFSAVIKDSIIHGRGTQDMKGGLVCWLDAVLTMIAQGVALPNLQFLITSDEEGPSTHGTILLMAYLQKHNILPDAAIVGEPSCALKVGDTIRRGRRGVFQAELVFQGQQRHSAYPDLGHNAIHKALPVLQALYAIKWGHEYLGFPLTTCQMTNIKAGTGAINVAPGTCIVTLDIRYNPSLTAEQISDIITKTCAGADVEIDLRPQANTFCTPDGDFLDMVCRSISDIVGYEVIRDTCGGTSDARFLAAANVPVVELGLRNNTIHQINECSSLDDMLILSHIYQRIIKQFVIT
ncbi:MAG: succinyl-diaminopimelate desuccinylase [Mariprofundales bacterium]